MSSPGPDLPNEPAQPEMPAVEDSGTVPAAASAGTPDEHFAWAHLAAPPEP